MAALLPRNFYARPSPVVALGFPDKAAHSYGGRRTPRNEVMYGRPGHAYVFLIYGLHNQLNLVTNAPDDPCAVLVRAVEPLSGEDRQWPRRC